MSDAATLTAPAFVAFDLLAMQGWPELRAVGDALDGLARRASETSHRDLEHAVTSLVRAVVVIDECPECKRTTGPAACVPYRLELDAAGAAIGTYGCDVGHAWRCSWAPREQLVGLT